MLNTDDLITLVDAYKTASGVSRDQTVSYRIFGDSKKLASLRNRGDITVSRFNASIEWLRENWPDGRAMPDMLIGGVHPPTRAHAPATIQGEGRE